ncbi:patatin-like phospholipase family protein [Clostridium sp.]|uniref:patatin-like phospholipase family protein n=1 Tax=Clostridium sp. TaxID=1506 RepID=UPI002A917D3C|nr:patatin-like phospholipase family protein [Clostridium sp.]MDY6011541.1 patatin-like phospholipase family protein [Clostridium sp.]
MCAFRIVSFDGGGIKGALSARIFKRFCDRYPEILKKTDLYAGVSTGSLIALLLASGKDADFVDNIYSYNNIKNVFNKNHLNFLRPKYNNKNLKNILSSVFKDTDKLSDLNKYVFIPSFSLTGLNSNTWEPVFFNNIEQNDNLSNYSIIDVALSSSAAPTYFPSHKGFIDGAVVTNMPTATALIKILKLYPKLDFSDFRILSIGTGITPCCIKRNTSKWGIMQWAYNPLIKMKKPLVSILLNDTIPLEDMYCKELLKDNFFRINPILENEIEMDDYKKVNDLKNLGSLLDLTDAYKYIENNFLN